MQLFPALVLTYKRKHKVYLLTSEPHMQQPTNKFSTTRLKYIVKWKFGSG